MGLLKTCCRTVIFIFLFFALRADAAIQPAHYGLHTVADQATIEKGTSEMMDSLLQGHPQMLGKLTVKGYTHAHTGADRTLDFYVLLFLCFVLGFIRLLDPRYFYNLWRAFTNPTLSNRQLKEQIQGAGISNLMMNIFFYHIGRYVLVLCDKAAYAQQGREYLVFPAYCNAYSGDDADIYG